MVRALPLTRLQPARTTGLLRLLFCCLASRSAGARGCCTLPPPLRAARCCCTLPLWAAADALGSDWVGVDAAGKPWTCATGQQQSPINLPAGASAAVRAVPNDQRALYELGTLASNGSNVVVSNTGHTVQVSWALPAAAGGGGSGTAPKVTIAVRGAWSRVS